MQLGTAVADPVQRLEQIRRQTADDEVLEQAAIDNELTQVDEQAAPATVAVASRWLGRPAVAAVRGMPHAACTVSDVPTPPGAAYLCGARMTYFSAILPIADGMGLVLAVTAYDGKVVISPTSCRELMPDPQSFTQCLRDSFQRYLALADGTPFRAGPLAPPAKPARRQRAGRGAGPKAGSRRASASDTSQPIGP